MTRDWQIWIGLTALIGAEGPGSTWEGKIIQLHDGADLSGPIAMVSISLRGHALGWAAQVCQSQSAICERKPQSLGLSLEFKKESFVAGRRRLRRFNCNVVEIEEEQIRRLLLVEGRTSRSTLHSPRSPQFHHANFWLLAILTSEGRPLWQVAQNYTKCNCVILADDERQTRIVLLVEG